MIEREAALPLLQRLGNPTLDAFGQAQAVVKRIRDAANEDIKALEPGVAGSYHGVSFWAFFSSKLRPAFDGILERDLTTSDQRHCWLTPEEEICIYLKSNIEELCFEQPMLDEFPSVDASGPALVVLTWEHLGVDRLHPTFIHLHNGQPQWEIPARELAESNVRAIRDSVPPPGMNLKKGARRSNSEEKTDKSN